MRSFLFHFSYFFENEFLKKPRTSWSNSFALLSLMFSAFSFELFSRVLDKKRFFSDSKYVKVLEAGFGQRFEKGINAIQV